MVEAVRLPFLSAAADPSSTILEMHRYYLEHPPHDIFLYDVLQVSPNATAAEISKAYRRLSLKYHPDKQLVQPNEKIAEATREALEKIREAHDILKEDRTRLPYHKFGLLDTAQALVLLTGQGSCKKDVALQKLLQLTGLTPLSTSSNQRLLSHEQREEERLEVLVADIVERLRPYIEGLVSLDDLIDAVTAECDEIKRLPMGAQIIRCVGRAYRSVGKSVWHHEGNEGTKLLQHKVQEKWRRTKHLMHAAVLSGRVVFTEKQIAKQVVQQIPTKSNPPSKFITYDGNDYITNHNTPFDDDDVDLMNEDGPSEEDIRLREHYKAREARFHSLQLEALWKISKIDLDRTIRRACKRVLKIDHNPFFPGQPVVCTEDKSWQPPPPPPPKYGQPPAPSPPLPRAPVDGWVGIPYKSSLTTSRQAVANIKPVHAVSAQQARIRAAEALAMLGDVMVQRSKEGTAWTE